MAPRILTHTTGQAGFAVNSYLIETPAAVVAVDAPFLLSDAHSFRAQLDALAKPLAGVLVTHGHPDHVNGIATLIAGLGDVPVLATAGVDRVHRDSAEPKRQQWLPVYGDDYPTTVVHATELVTDGQVVELAGLELVVRDLGPGESPSASAWLLEERVFVGDLAYDDVHPYLLEPDLPAWLEQLAAAPEWLPAGATLLPGHGLPAGQELLNRQRGYLEAYVAAVDELRDGGGLDEGAVGELERRMDERLPGGALRMLVALNARPGRRGARSGLRLPPAPSGPQERNKRRAAPAHRRGAALVRRESRPCATCRRWGPGRWSSTSRCGGRGRSAGRAVGRAF